MRGRYDWVVIIDVDSDTLTPYIIHHICDQADSLAVVAVVLSTYIYRKYH